MFKKRSLRVELVALCLSFLLGIAAPAAFRVSAEAETSLWLVTEETAADEMNAVVEFIIKQFQQEHPGVSIRMDILPNQEQAREESLQHIREEMENGTGPDLYLLPTGTTLTLDHPQKYTYRRIDPLFPDVAAAMELGAFADISTYYDRDTDLDKDGLNQSVMDAGSLDGARYVLPLRYGMPMLYAFDELLADAGISKQMLEGSIESIMREAVQTRNLNLAYCADMASATVFSNLLTRGEGALRVEQVADYLKDYQALKALIGTESLHLSRFDYLAYEAGPKSLRSVYRGTISDALNFLAVEKASGLTLSMYPLRTTTGDAMAFVTYYGAVGSSCQSPELAYEFLRQFLLEDVQWEKGRNMMDGEWPLSPMEDGWPVRTKGSVKALLANIQGNLSADSAYQPLANLYLSDDSLPILETKIDLVCFPVQTDFEKLLSQLNNYNDANTPADVDIDALAEEFITGLQGA